MEIVSYIYMSKTRMMGAGYAGSSAYYNTGTSGGVNSNKGGGSKLQGLAPTTNKPVRYALRNIKRRANGERRNVVFCMNQIGGIGAVGGGNRSRMFAPTADGVKDCVPGSYQTKAAALAAAEKLATSDTESDVVSDTESDVESDTESQLDTNIDSNSDLKSEYIDDLKRILEDTVIEIEKMRTLNNCMLPPRLMSEVDKLLSEIKTDTKDEVTEIKTDTKDTFMYKIDTLISDIDANPILTSDAFDVLSYECTNFPVYMVRHAYAMDDCIDSNPLSVIAAPNPPITVTGEDQCVEWVDWFVSTVPGSPNYKNHLRDVKYIYIGVSCLLRSQQTASKIYQTIQSKLSSHKDIFNKDVQFEFFANKWNTELCTGFWPSAEQQPNIPKLNGGG